MMFHKVPNVRFRKKLRVRTENHDFPSKFFWFRVPKDFVVEDFGISQKISAIEKFHA